MGAVALAPAVAEHPEDAPDYTGDAFFEISEVSQSDHHPGDHQGSMQYFSGGADAFHQQDAEEGVWIDYIIVDSFYDGEQWIDYSECSTENTAAFGIDRGGNNSGTNYDEDLVQKQKQADFRDDGITVEFYNHEDLGGDPPYMAPEDHIVAEQGENSAGGACLQFTDEPGWYRMAGFLNGTVADNGPNEAPSDNADNVQVQVQSTWFYICDCDSREEAEEELGPPPEDDSEAQADDGAGGDDGGSSDDGGDSTPTEESTPADEGTPTDDGAGGDDGASGDEGTPTDDGAGSDDSAGDDSAGDDSAGDDGAGSDDSAGDDGAGTNDSTGDDGAGTNDSTGAGTNDSTGNDTGQGDADTFGNDSEGTPTADDGPGFGAVAALLALLGSALLLNRRR